MAELVLTNCKFYLNEFDYSGDMNALALNYGAEILDKSQFGDTSRTRIAGVKAQDFSHSGLADFADDGNDEKIFGLVGSEVIVTAGAVDGTEGDVAYFNKAILGEYKPEAGHGEIVGFNITGMSSTPFLRGEVLQTDDAETASGNSSGQQHAAAVAGQTVYAALHVIAASGTSPTLDVILQSDDNGSFTSAANRITFTQATGLTSEWKSVAGAITDDFWRANFTIGGTSPSFTFILVMGIY